MTAADAANQSSDGVRITTTGQGAYCTHAIATAPTTSRLSPVRPWDPTPSRSAASATSTSVSAGAPGRIVRSTSGGWSSISASAASTILSTDSRATASISPSCARRRNVAPKGMADIGDDHECTTSTVACRRTPSARAQRRATAACSESSTPTTMRPRAGSASASGAAGVAAVVSSGSLVMDIYYPSTGHRPPTLGRTSDMTPPLDIGIIDTMIGFPARNMRKQYAFITQQTHDKESKEDFEFPVEYMFKDVPDKKLDKGADPLEVTLREMDLWGVEKGVI